MPTVYNTQSYYIGHEPKEEENHSATRKINYIYNSIHAVIDSTMKVDDPGTIGCVYYVLQRLYYCISHINNNKCAHT